MIDARDFVAKCRTPLDEKWGYIWGAHGGVHTQAAQDAATREQTVRYGQRWVGKRVVDCSGLLYWAAKELGGYIYHGSNTIWNKYCCEKGEITPGMSMLPGTAVFLNKDGSRHHVGVFIGGNTVIESKGTLSGVVTSAVGSWDEWGTLSALDYSSVQPEIIKAALPVLRQGSSGGSVKYMQQLLGAAGHSLNADGVFGSETLSALLSFQSSRGLTADGICGPLTWAALETVPMDQPQPEGDDDQEPGWKATIDRMNELNRQLDGIHQELDKLIEAVDQRMEAAGA